MITKYFEYVIGEEFCSKVTDGTHDTPKPVKNGKHLITSKHIKGDKIDFDSAYLISELDFNAINKRSKVDQWDVIISMIGAYCGFCFLESSSEIDYAVKNVGLFKAGSEINAKWLYYYLNSPVGKSHLNAARGGSTQPYISLGSLRELPILIPKDELRKKHIVDTLDLLDRKLRINSNINTELESIAKTLYDYWFVQFDFPDSDGKPYKSSGGRMIYNNALKREIPYGWDDDVIQNVIDKVPSSNKISAKEFRDLGSFPIIDQSQDFICGYTDDEKSVIKPDTAHIIFGDHTRVVKLVNFEYARGADGTQVLVAKSDRVPSYLLYQIVSDIDLSNYGYARHYKFLKDSKCIVPEVLIAQKFQLVAQSLHAQIKCNIMQNQELQKLKDWLLPMLMNGQVTVKQ